MNQQGTFTVNLSDLGSILQPRPLSVDSLSFHYTVTCHRHSYDRLLFNTLWVRATNGDLNSFVMGVSPDCVQCCCGAMVITAGHTCHKKETGGFISAAAIRKLHKVPSRNSETWK